MTQPPAPRIEPSRLLPGACLAVPVGIRSLNLTCALGCVAQLVLAGELSATLSHEAITSNDLGRLGETQAMLGELADCGWLLERSLLTAVDHQLRWAKA